MDYNVTLSNENFKQLTTCLEVVSTFIDDVDIRQGVIRQGNISKTAILSMDLSTIFDKDLCTSNIKNKLPLFSLLAEDGKDVEISCKTNKYTINGQERTEKAWFISNGISAFKFLWSDPVKLSTKFTEEEAFNNNVLQHTKDDNIIVSIDVLKSPELKKKIKKVSDSFNNDKLTFRTDGQKYWLESISMDKRANAKIMSEDLPQESNEMYETQTKNDFVNTEGALEKLIYYKPAGEMTVDSANPKRKKGHSWVLAVSRLTDKITFSTYNFSRTFTEEVSVKETKKAKAKEVVEEQPKPVEQPTPVITEGVPSVNLDMIEDEFSI